MLTEILHQRPGRPSWLVGETKAERVERMASTDEPDSSRWYRNSYPRRIVSMRSVADVESGKLPSLSNMAGDFLRVRIIDMTEEERQGAASGKLKVQGNHLVPVTFDDRLGAVATKLRERHADPETWERKEKLRVETEEADNETKRKDYDFALEAYRVLRDDFPVELHKWSLTASDDDIPPAMPERPKALRLQEVYESSFDREANAIARALAPTVTNTGTGNYFAKVTPTQLDRTQSGAPVGQTVTFTAGGLGTADAFIGGYITNVTRSETRAIVSHIDDAAVLEGSLTNWLDTDDLDIFDAWSTIQAALDQLFTDQGATTFTASQYVRIFAGTYAESVLPNAALDQNELLGFQFIMEGDSTDPRANMVIQPTTGSAVFVNCDQALLRHVTIDGASCTSNVLGQGSGSGLFAVEDVDVTGPVTASLYVVRSSFCLTLDDCVITANGFNATLFAEATHIRNCIIKQNGARGTSLGAAVGTGVVVEGCTISGFNRGILAGRFGAFGESPVIDLSQNTVYDCDIGIALSGGGNSSFAVINNIVKDCTTVFSASVWPEETSTAFGPRLTQRNNAFHGFTTFADDGSGTRTHAQWIAFNRVDEADDILTDPLLTSPGTGDFSLQTASPCKWTGHGSGVIAGVNGVAFDPANPDIGAWSSGIVPAPSWTADTSNIVATDLAQTGEVGLAWDSADATVLTNLSKGYIVESRVGAGAYTEHFRTITTSGTVGALTDDIAREFRITAFTRVEAEPSGVASDTDTATPTGIEIPAAPVITATDQLNQVDVLVELVAGNALDVSTIFYQITPGGALQTWPTTITGDGSQTLTLTVKPYVIYAVAQRGGCNSVASNLEFLTVKAANQFTNIQTALREWIKGVVGDPKVLFRESNAPQSLRPYVTLKMGPTVVIGHDQHGDNDATGVETVTGDREFVLSVQVHGKPANEDQGEVISIMERIRSSLEKTSIQDTLSAAGIAFRGVEGTGDLSGIGGTQWEARAFKDFKFGITHSDTDDVGQISTVETPVGTFE